MSIMTTTPTHHNPNYIITSISINNSNYLSAMGQIPHHTDLNIDITVTNPDVLNTSNDLMEAVGNMFESNLPDWCTPEMMHEALKEKYPERYL